VTLQPIETGESALKSDIANAGKRIVISSLALFVSIALGAIIYRGPAPRSGDAPLDRPAAARMRTTLVQLLGDPPEKHTTGTDAGEAFLKRLESKIASMGVESRRIEIPWKGDAQDRHPKGRVDLLPPDAVLKNLLVTVPGTDPELAPILVATHHDSCRWGPGAGDAGSAVVALVEHIRIMANHPPNRTTEYLFTDGEEYGLLGAYAIAEQDPLPFPAPVFVLNFDARGTSGGVPMFETHRDNRSWVNALIGNLAWPKMTSSLAVTVYRALPNATDFTVWHGKLGLSGFNYATIGGAHRYHRPADSPENVSDRTLQHMGDHLFSMHAAIDDLDPRQTGELIDNTARQTGDSAVFFDLFGTTVVHFGETTQKVLAVVALLLLVSCRIRRGASRGYRKMAFDSGRIILTLFAGLAIGWLANLMLRSTPWGDLRYTPVDQPAGLFTVVATFLIATLLLERFLAKRHADDLERISDWIWLITAGIGVLLAFTLPGGAYLLVLPSLVYGLVRFATQKASPAAWCGWTATVILIGPLLTVLVIALGPWKQPLYAVLAGLLAVQAMTTWIAQGTEKGRSSSESPVL
jgi:hypothetical protein